MTDLNVNDVNVNDEDLGLGQKLCIDNDTHQTVLSASGVTLINHHAVVFSVCYLWHEFTAGCIYTGPLVVLCDLIESVVVVSNWCVGRFCSCCIGWSYSPQKGWEGAFLPVSTTCTVYSNARTWDANHDSVQVRIVVVGAWNEPCCCELLSQVPHEVIC